MPEFSADQYFHLGWDQLFEEVQEARELGHNVKPVVIGPLTYLCLGVVNGRNVWRCDLEKALATLQHAHEKLGDRLWVAPSCSLLHSPVDLGREDKLAARRAGVAHKPV